MAMNKNKSVKIIFFIINYEFFFLSGLSMWKSQIRVKTVRNVWICGQYDEYFGSQNPLHHQRASAFTTYSAGTMLNTERYQENIEFTKNSIFG